MFHFPRCRPPRLFDSARGRRDRPAGLPHSETHGSRAACASPWNIAACRVLRRHPLPRHPSCARKACPQEKSPAGAPPDFLRCPCGKPCAERAQAPPSAFYSTFKVFLSFASGCQRAPPPRDAAEGNRSGMVGAPGLEPGTSSLSEKRSNQLSYAPAGNIGGAEGTRTHDILLAKQALYQLSYGPLGGPRPPGNQAAQYETSIGLARNIAGLPL